MKKILVLISIGFSCFSAQANTNNTQNQIACGEFQGEALTDSELNEMGDFFNNEPQYCEEITSDDNIEFQQASGFIKVDGRSRRNRSHKGKRNNRRNKSHRKNKSYGDYSHGRRHHRPRHNPNYGRGGNYNTYPIYSGHICRNGYYYCFMLFPGTVGYGCACPGFYGTITNR